MTGLSIKCSFCGIPLTMPGGLLFSPPILETDYVIKRHVCSECYLKLLKLVNFLS